MNSAAWIVIGIVVMVGLALWSLCVASKKEPPKPEDEDKSVTP